jgi:hypothetical protein
MAAGAVRIGTGLALGLHLTAAVGGAHAKAVHTAGRLPAVHPLHPGGVVDRGRQLCIGPWTVVNADLDGADTLLTSIIQQAVEGKRVPVSDGRKVRDLVRLAHGALWYAVDLAIDQDAAQIQPTPGEIRAVLYEAWARHCERDGHGKASEGGTGTYDFNLAGTFVRCCDPACGWSMDGRDPRLMARLVAQRRERVKGCTT